MSAFGALPAGNYNGGNYNNFGNNANFWSATENENNTNNAYNLNLGNGNANVNNNNKDNAFSVRCLKDSEERAAREGWLRLALFAAYKEARKHKRNTINQLKFEKNLEHNIFCLAHELATLTYELSPSVCFINEKPIKREIIAADFRDRVVHHLLYSWIYPIFDRQFIYDSYSCRVGKGTLFGINRAQNFIRRASCNFSRPAYVLRLDISGFFMAINRSILFKSIINGLEKAGWRDVPDPELALFLIRKFVFNNPLENARFRSPPSAWDDLPASKSLMTTAPNCGLPIGNLTSQLFGNIYLNKLDHFIKRTLKMRYYGRYVDDMFLIHHDKALLLTAIERIRSFLAGELALTLHPHKVYLQNITKGFPFLGAYILPYRTYPGRRIAHNAQMAFKCKNSNTALQKAREISYLGLLGHFAAFKLAGKLGK